MQRAALTFLTGAQGRAAAAQRVPGDAHTHTHARTHARTHTHTHTHTLTRLLRHGAYDLFQVKRGQADCWMQTYAAYISQGHT